MSADMDRRTAQYIALRDRIKQIDDAHKEERNKYVTLMDEVAGHIQAFMEANKLENLKTEHGTCYTSTKTSASLADADAFMKFVIDNKMFDLLDRRANATAVKAYVEEHKGLPPGVSLNQVQTLGVRRPSGK
jgi:hypothetical protein